MNREIILRQRIKFLTWFFIFGLVVSGATAIPLEWELGILAKLLGASGQTSSQVHSGFAHWILRVREALQDNGVRYPFMAYGTDWLAFGHFAIAVAFIGALKDPIRNKWLFTFGMIACVMIIPYAFIMGAVRGIPVYWRLIDCSFGIIGIVPVWYCLHAANEVEKLYQSMPARKVFAARD